jgi:hypothetical protein
MVDDAQERDLATILEAITAAEDKGVDSGAPIQDESRAFADMTCGVVRPNHARAGLQSPDSVIWFEFEQLRMFVAANLVNAGGREFVLLVLGSGADDQDVITSAFRLYVDDESAAELAKDARKAFQRFLEHHAIPYKPEGVETLFRPVVRAPITGPPLETIMGMLGLEFTEGKSWKAIGAMRHDGSTVTMAFPFVLDTTNYLAFVREHGWGG